MPVFVSAEGLRFAGYKFYHLAASYSACNTAPSTGVSKVSRSSVIRRAADSGACAHIRIALRSKSITPSCIHGGNAVAVALRLLLFISKRLVNRTEAKTELISAENVSRAYSGAGGYSARHIVVQNDLIAVVVVSRCAGS